MKLKKKILLALAVLVAIVVITFFAGPVPADFEFDAELTPFPHDLKELESYIEEFEASRPVRPGNQAHILWHDSIRQKTEYSFLYLHGFAGSYRDGYPLNKMVADYYDGNIYMARLIGHGLEPEYAMINFDAEHAWESACAALSVATRLGKKVVIISTSTGGTLAITLAAVFPDQVHALINISPNIRDEVPGSTLLNTPWGSEIATLAFLGDTRNVEHEEDSAKLYWDTQYPVKAALSLQNLLEKTMIPETYQEVRCPVLTLYYHKNFIAKDWRVDIDLYPEVHKQFGTPDSLKRLVALETPGTHFIGSSIKSDDYRTAVLEILDFCSNVVGMKSKRDTLPDKSFAENL